MTVRVQAEDFDLGHEVAQLTLDTNTVGAVVSFIGLVRDTTGGDLLAMELEHYPGMTEQALAAIDAEATKRWSLAGSTVIHRYGHLKTGEQIMMVATASAHRKDAFEAAEFLMDYLKTDAPFWKKEHLKSGSQWVESKKSDEDAKDRWKA
ncbi:molybdenum cofactor biosynthesis protein MoaE [Amylibacter sp. SFDW26]|uniref:molybdenum cofactor biosynthesis protein MoaE n=1 Tax=Amylibacter sp. SFDW26 TaxID=2652722 RepID=UPI001262979A|nr:molybdenum cofactor biosynthesis protein MoaE [Amylibacter sp. SFDW26]KAB7613974.1 molybdenum cofactor biosynthesis protein MoaE [Amylibacter sp. SFDW26]